MHAHQRVGVYKRPLLQRYMLIFLIEPDYGLVLFLLGADITVS